MEYEKLKHVFSEFDFTIQRHIDHGMDQFSLNLSSIFRALGDPVHCFYLNENQEKALGKKFQRNPTAIHREVHNRLPSKHRTRFFLVFLKKENSTYWSVFHKAFIEKKCAILDVQPFLDSKNISHTIRDVLLKYENGFLVKPEFLNPYGFDRIPGEKMFFGRGQLLEKLSSSQTNFAIVGARRVGKSSLMHELQRRAGRIIKIFAINKNSEFLKCSYVDLRLVDDRSISSFCGAIIQGFKLDIERIPAGRVLSKKGGYSTNTKRALSYLVRENPKELTIILDEVDEWLKSEKENGWECLSYLQSLCDNEQAQLILVGYETLDYFLVEDKFPLYGRTERIHLKNLDRDSVVKLVLGPLTEFRIRFENEQQMAESIWNASSSGMAHIVQDICRNLIQNCYRRNRFLVKYQFLQESIRRASQLQTFISSIFTIEDKIASGIFAVCCFVGVSDSGELTLISELPKAFEKPIKIQQKYIWSVLQNQPVVKMDNFIAALRFLEIRNILIQVSPYTWQISNPHARKSFFQRVISFGGLSEWLPLQLNS